MQSDNEICHQYNVLGYIKISRSGNGARAQFFFEEKISAAQARRLGTALLINTIQNHYLVGKLLIDPIRIELFSIINKLCSYF